MAITHAIARAFDVPMRSPYRSAKRLTTTAHNVLVTFTGRDAFVGVGESAPATYVTGETQASVLDAVTRFFAVPLPADLDDLLARARAELAASPGAWGAVEMAVLDAEAQATGVALYRILNPGLAGNAPFSHVSDLSLPLLAPEDAGVRAAQAATDGFRALKLKVGGGDVADDIARVRAVANAAPYATLRLDGNQAFTPETALALINGLADLLPRIELFEQPTPAGDDEAMAAVHRALPANIPVFADESCHDADDAKRLIESSICGGVVLKLAKSGISGAMAIAQATHRAGGKCLFGCMMETRIGIGAALHAVIALEESGIIPLLDLDGHLLTDDAGLLSGGFTQTGDMLTANESPGLGVSIILPQQNDTFQRPTL